MCHSSFASCPLFSCLFCFSLPTHRSYLVFVRATGTHSNFTPKNINSPARLHAGDVIKVRCHRRHSAEIPSASLVPAPVQHPRTADHSSKEDRASFRRVSTPPVYSSGEAGYAYLDLDRFGATALSLTTRLHLYKRGSIILFGRKSCDAPLLYANRQFVACSELSCVYLCLCVSEGWPRTYCICHLSCLHAPFPMDNLRRLRLGHVISVWPCLLSAFILTSETLASFS
ncbi:hypothetical protein EDB86DRAFT_176445 [Lactarius hatsudake]|nr:hypothetical protein EDB86DRAFT_176445 [Lactarius hatsudake]